MGGVRPHFPCDQITKDFPYDQISKDFPYEQITKDPPQRDSVTGALQERYTALQRGDFQLGYVAVSSEVGTVADRLSVLRNGDSPSFSPSLDHHGPQPW